MRTIEEPGINQLFELKLSGIERPTHLYASDKFIHVILRTLEHHNTRIASEIREKVDQLASHIKGQAQVTDPIFAMAHTLSSTDQCEMSFRFEFAKR